MILIDKTLSCARLHPTSRLAYIPTMKTSWSLLGALSLSCNGVTAFSGSALSASFRTTRSSTTAVEAVSSRRDWCQGVAAGAAAVLATAASSTPASASMNFDQVQDLLGSPTDATQPYVPGVGKRPTYLTEPTAEFKENEGKASAFKRQQLLDKKAFQTSLDKITTDPNDETALVADMDDLGRKVRIAHGLPAGITKEEVVKQIRRRKAKKFWPTQCELAYQDLMNEIRYQQSPNTDNKNMDNPF